MKIDDFNELPEWNDHEFENEEGEAWKPNPTKDACKAMYQQWNMVMTVLRASLDSLKEPGEDDMFNKEMLEHQVAMLTSDAYQVAVKIKSSETGLYIIRMENAAIIRKNAQYIYISTNGFVYDGLMEPQHRQILRDEIDRFRELFKTWVATFKKDEYEDEWGLFI